MNPAAQAFHVLSVACVLFGTLDALQCKCLNTNSPAVCSANHTCEAEYGCVISRLFGPTGKGWSQNCHAKPTNRSMSEYSCTEKTAVVNDTKYVWRSCSCFNDFCNEQHKVPDPQYLDELHGTAVRPQPTPPVTTVAPVATTKAVPKEVSIVLAVSITATYLFYFG
ncbi:hypothetical protein L596_015887 [Steinernema carpocapsae]|uniref:Activin types I and II receptor domain-containing protein n=1 Tax=Steinernema carpocapsae TaxID=34508 RepID=A0A4U5NGY3_STECR|nr:hypothetical protein L596_015887 [Steinernema carpocapsae]